MLLKEGVITYTNDRDAAREEMYSIIAVVYRWSNDYGSGVKTFYVEGDSEDPADIEKILRLFDLWEERSEGLSYYHLVTIWGVETARKELKAKMSQRTSSQILIDRQELQGKFDEWAHGCPSGIPASSYYCSLVDDVLEWAGNLLEHDKGGV